MSTYCDYPCVLVTVKCMCMCMCIYIYICEYRERDGDVHDVEDASLQQKS